MSPRVICILAITFDQWFNISKLHCSPAPVTPTPKPRAVGGANLGEQHGCQRAVVITGGGALSVFVVH